mmetsp:Transcript_32028/g.78584  ORF Transcript_32028/g.78584 Transcript_32028/m.78584 type:complete len:241 (-) Transcript_32028:1969-2691(-)
MFSILFCISRLSELICLRRAPSWAVMSAFSASMRSTSRWRDTILACSSLIELEDIRLSTCACNDFSCSSFRRNDASFSWRSFWNCSCAAMFSERRVSILALNSFSFWCILCLMSSCALVADARISSILRSWSRCSFCSSSSPSSTAFCRSISAASRLRATSFSFSRIFLRSASSFFECSNLTSSASWSALAFSATIWARRLDSISAASSLSAATSFACAASSSSTRLAHVLVVCSTSRSH